MITGLRSALLCARVEMHVDGRVEAATAFPLMVPVLQEGTLWVTVVDDGARTKPLRRKWRLKFTADAPALENPSAAQQIAETCQRARPTRH